MEPPLTFLSKKNNSSSLAEHFHVNNRHNVKVIPIQLSTSSVVQELFL